MSDDSTTADGATATEHCLHTWVLDRPESDTWECLVCGYEGVGRG